MALHLSDREIQVLSLLCQGLTCVEIGQSLFISHETVRSHRKSLNSKLGVKTAVQLGAVGHRYLHRLDK